MNFFIGCAIWGYKAWVGDLFPVGSRATDFLHLYSHRFTAVEGNTTFYSIPDADTIARWVAETPPGFKFCLKVPRDITHQGALAPRLTEAIAFLEHMAKLGDRLGPLFAQLPPSYGPAQLEDLTAFLQGWQNRAPLALEVRHPDWFREPHARTLNALLHNLQMGRVLLDTRPIYDCPDDPQLHSERRKPRVPLQPVLTANFTVIRYISHPDLAFNQMFLQEWMPQIDAWLRQDRQVYVFVHCPVEARSPHNARHFHHLLEQHQVPIPPLPWDSIHQPSTQLSLF